MKNIQLINDDFEGKINNLRHACRGILYKDGNVLLGFESLENKYIIPGGGVEEGETLTDCCEREMLEETGMKVKARSEYLEIEELFLDWRHVNHYFVCELIEDTGVLHLTDYEEEAGCTFVWMPLKEAIDVFGDYEKFHKTNIADYGLYRREHAALKEFADFLNV